jgi:hypothetical protein
LYQWDFNYSKEKGFKAEVMIDKEGIQKKIFKSGSYNIALRATDIDGAETTEEIKLVINGGVKIDK